jgi:hypothetical protein
MLKIAARRGSTIALSVLFCALLGGAAMADPAIQRTQRPSEGSPGQHACMPYARADQQLRAHFDEKVLGRGISSDGTLIEIFMSPKRTFTVIKTTPSGMSCVVDFGDGWQTLNQLEAVGFTPEDLKTLSN